MSEEDPRIKFPLEIDVPINIPRYHHLQAWLKDHFGVERREGEGYVMVLCSLMSGDPRIKAWNAEHILTFYFNRDEDMIAFKLTWGDLPL